MKRQRGKQHSSKKAISRTGPGKILTVVFQGFIVLIALVMAGSMVDHLFINPSVSSVRTDSVAPTKVERHIQVTVRNECGANDVAMDFTNFLRKRGFDVVETDNGSEFDLKTTMVIDATGNYQNAVRVAEALGVRKKNVITRLDPHAYVDVIVLIGRDFNDLKPKEGIE